MEKKISLSVITVICWFITLFFVQYCYAQQDNDEVIFKKRLHDFLFGPSSINVSLELKKQGQRLLGDLLNFTKEFPESRYADDAQYVPLYNPCSFRR